VSHDLDLSTEQATNVSIGIKEYHDLIKVTYPKESKSHDLFGETGDLFVVIGDSHAMCVREIIHYKVPIWKCTTLTLKMT